MRDDLNAILTFIGSASLTDEEFESIELESLDDQVAVYQSLLGILGSRESNSVTTARLRSYFLAKGVNVSPARSGSNIFVGSSLE